MNKVHIISVRIGCIVWQLMLSLFNVYSDNAQPVCLPTQDDLLSNATNCYITGFGSIVQSILDRKYIKCFVAKMNIAVFIYQLPFSDPLQNCPSPTKFSPMKGGQKHRHLPLTRRA